MMSKMAAFNRNEWQFTATKLPTNKELMPTISNGFLGTRIFDDTIYAAGVFNGDALNSHRARIPSTIPVQIDISFQDNSTYEAAREYKLDAKNGCFGQSLLALNGAVEIQQNIYAHRAYRNLIIAEVKAKTSLESGFKMSLKCNTGAKSDDIAFKKLKIEEFMVMQGMTIKAEQADVKKTEVAIAYSPEPYGPIEIAKAETYTYMYFITSVSSSLDSGDAKEKAIAEYKNAKILITEGYGPFWESHLKAWQQIWQAGEIRIEGDLELAQAVNSSMYYIISSIEASWPYGLSPGGLPSNGYLGHTFWDQETWMYPTLLLFHQKLAKSCLHYRFERMTNARQRAKQNGYEGLMFPWESAFSGVEVCPEPFPYSKFEHHIIGDIGFAVQQFWMATHDADWFKCEGIFLMKGVAEFWASRVTFDEETDTYFINHVQGPDEYHYNVNNSVYTNVIAKINLEFAVYILEHFSTEVPATWSRIAMKMYVPYDKTHKYHPEFDGYELKTTVKQADVILLGFPLMHEMSEHVRKNDLDIYEACTDQNGPAMTKAMFAVGWLELKEFQKASISFKEGYANITEPFKVWTETPDGGEVNFITGAGGFLQSVVFGYGGLRLKLDGLHLDPVLPDHTGKIGFYGLTYLGNKFNLEFDSQQTIVMVTEQFKSYEKLTLLVKGSKQEFQLNSGIQCKFENGSAVIKF